MEKKKKIRIAFDVDEDLYEKWIEKMLEQKITNKSMFFRHMISLGIAKMLEDKIDIH